MDCDKFDQHVMDALYGELDELTAEALKRHVDSCARCAATWSSLKSTRGALTLPLDEPSANLESRILAAEKTQFRRAPWYRKVLRGAAWAGSHAMRPQLAMAALFMFVIGSSVLLLRTRPGAPVQVSEQGRPETRSTPNARAERAESKGAAAATATPAARPMAAAAPEAAADNNQEGEYGAMETQGSAAAAAAPPGDASGGDETADGLLARGRAKKLSTGCEAALPSFQGVVAKYPDSPQRSIAEAKMAECQRARSSATVTAIPTMTTFDGGDAQPTENR